MPYRVTALCALAVSLFSIPTLGLFSEAEQKKSDLPFLPDGEWRVHDPDRPLPVTVTADAPTGDGFVSAPSDAVRLFGGDKEDLSAWTTLNEQSSIWPVENGVLMTNSEGDRAKHGAEISSIQTKQSFGDVQLHLEFRIPARTGVAFGQWYGNSGVILMGKYEVQILNSFENETYADGQAAALYGWKPPLVNASRAPGHWQEYDIIFEAPEFSNTGELIEPAIVTVLHNGVLVHNRQEFLGASAWREVATYHAHEPELPLILQHHGETVHFRNIWVRRLN